MPELTRLDPRDYVREVKARLQDDAGWEELLAPELVEKTRRTLLRMIGSIDEQKRRSGEDDEKWVRNINRLRTLVKTRLDAMPAPVPQSSNKGTKAWKELAARLAKAHNDGEGGFALTYINIPYSQMSVDEWLEAREEKKR